MALRRVLVVGLAVGLFVLLQLFLLSGSHEPAAPAASATLLEERNGTQPLLSSSVSTRDESEETVELESHPFGDECRAIFTITTGRSGSAYLQKLMSTLDNVDAYHEVGTWARANLERYCKLGLEETREQREETWQVVLDKFFNVGKVHVHTSHLFAKDWYDVAVESMLEGGCRVDILVLRRSFIQIVASLKRIGFHKMIPDWYYYVDRCKLAVTNSVKRTDREYRGWGRKEQWDIFAYLIDVEAHFHLLRSLYPSVTFHEVDLLELQSADFVVSFLEGLDLTVARGRVENVVGERVNLKGAIREEYSELDIVADLEEYCNELRETHTLEGIPEIVSLRQIEIPNWRKEFPCVSELAGV